MSTIEPMTVQVGRHEFAFTPPDEACFTFLGDFNETHVDGYLDFMFQCGDRCGEQLYGIYDLRQFTRVTGGARKRVVKVERPYPLVALAAVGASFATRTAAGMILTAGKLVAPHAFKFSIKFVANRDEARAWFDELRKKAATT